MPDTQSRRFYIVRQLQVAGKLSTKVAGNHLLLSVTGGSERCRSGSEISGARLYQRQSAERRSGGVEGCRIRDELIIACSNSRHQVRNSHASRLFFDHPRLDFQSGGGNAEAVEALACKAGLSGFESHRPLHFLGY
jgi:hypothetical protein